MTNTPINLPYFDWIFEALADQDPAVETALQRHIHWGYWPNIFNATTTPEDYHQAAERLTQAVYHGANVQNGQQVLDVGCGFGGTIASLNENYSNMTLVGLNIDERQLDRARKSIQPQENNSIEFVQGNACSLPFEDNSFDVVLAVECIFHFPDRKQFLQEAFRVLKPGGYLSLSDFIPTAIAFPIIETYQTLEGDPGFYGQANLAYSLTDYRQVTHNTGFQTHLEQDITIHTLPTYTFLIKLGLNRDYLTILRNSALMQTFLIALASHLQLIKYMILAYQKTR